MATALVSALTRRPSRRDLAMTGEITLRGKVLPVGGIKDKALAAFRAGIREIILPGDNEKDFDEVPAEVREQLTVHFVESMDEVLRLALEGELASPPPGGGELAQSSAATPTDSGSLAH
jgi:ATP-dependent Lon protease